MIKAIKQCTSEHVTTNTLVLEQTLSSQLGSEAQAGQCQLIHMSN